MEKFTFTGFLLRLAGAIILVFITFNPTGHSYYHWLAHDTPAITPLKTVVGILLLAGWLVFITATARSIGLLGVALCAAFFAAVIWLISSWGWLDPHNATGITWIVLLVSSIVLAIGMSWSHVRRRLTGQADVDEVDQK